MMHEECSSCFPAPLVLPDDDLSLEPEEGQSLHEWKHLKERNKITPEKSVVYVARFPEVSDDVEFVVNTWKRPKRAANVSVPSPRFVDVFEYISAFYHGLSVEQFPHQLSFSQWNTGKKSTTSPRFIGLSTGTERVRIRTRKVPDGAFERQLNLDDLLDSAISMLPENAYALVLLVEHDLYEDADDIFVCGRAYGGSRVAVVSTARYHPALDESNGVDRLHSWPASHCETYMEACCTGTSHVTKKFQSGNRTMVKRSTNVKTRSQTAFALLSNCDSSDENAVTPLEAAVSTFNKIPPSASAADLSGLWLGRVCRTVSHELGHCFGIAHCPYYACSMQGSASLAEDARQPPYLCPVDLAKLLHVTGTGARQRYEGLLSFCERRADIHLFAAFAAWIRARLEHLGLNCAVCNSTS